MRQSASASRLLIENYADDPAGAGARLAALVNERIDDARCLCVLPDGLLGNCTALLDSLHNGLSRTLPVVGGAAADAMTFKRTFGISRS
ncbi:MAG: FIST N-terminal domain-containing protein [Vicinamibacterales bacterium]